ncbi:hypothetical protein EX30DRAFT_340964, partial [Ascodesmis nigricans]
MPTTSSPNTNQDSDSSYHPDTDTDTDSDFDSDSNTTPNPHRHNTNNILWLHRDGPSSDPNSPLITWRPQRVRPLRRPRAPVHGKSGNVRGGKGKVSTRRKKKGGWGKVGGVYVKRLGLVGNLLLWCALAMIAGYCAEFLVC